MSYKKLMANLKVLPETQRLLASAVYFYYEGGDERCGCVLGKGLPLMRDKFQMSNRRPITAVYGEADTGAMEGLTLIEADEAQLENDRYREVGGEKNSIANRAARYDHMIKWLEEQVAQEI